VCSWATISGINTVCPRVGVDRMGENNVSISVTLLVSIKIETEKEVEGFPVYSVPRTTNPQLVEINFDEYKVPETTGGFL